MCSLVISWSTIPADDPLENTRQTVFYRTIELAQADEGQTSYEIEILFAYTRSCVNMIYLIVNVIMATLGRMITFWCRFTGFELEKRLPAADKLLSSAELTEVTCDKNTQYLLRALLENVYRSKTTAN